jgi:hypothetical protein
MAGISMSLGFIGREFFEPGCFIGFRRAEAGLTSFSGCLGHGGLSSGVWEKAGIKEDQRLLV